MNLFYTRYIFTCFFLLTTLPTRAAQSTIHPQAQKIITAVKIPVNFEASFRYILQAKGEEAVTFQGKAFIKGDKYHLILTDQVIFSDGKSIWHYYEDLQEIHIHTATSYKTVKHFSPLDLLQLYHKDFVPVALKHYVKKGKEYDEVMLRPKKNNTFITQLVVTLRSKQQKIKAIHATDQEGVIHQLVVLKLKAQQKIPDSYFEFLPPTDETIEVIDFR